MKKNGYYYISKPFFASPTIKFDMLSILKYNCYICKFKHT